MQVCVDVTYMHTNFGGHDLSASKNLINRNQLKKFMQVCVDVTYMHTNFGGRDLSSFGDIATFKKSQFSLSTHGL